jgi:hypothetical protein
LVRPLLTLSSPMIGGQAGGGAGVVGLWLGERRPVMAREKVRSGASVGPAFAVGRVGRSSSVTVAGCVAWCVVVGPGATPLLGCGRGSVVWRGSAPGSAGVVLSMEGGQ